MAVETVSAGGDGTGEWHLPAVKEVLPPLYRPARVRYENEDGTATMARIYDLNNVEGDEPVGLNWPAMNGQDNVRLRIIETDKGVFFQNGREVYDVDATYHSGKQVAYTLKAGQDLPNTSLGGPLTLDKTLLGDGKGFKGGLIQRVEVYQGEGIVDSADTFGDYLPLGGGSPFREYLNWAAETRTRPQSVDAKADTTAAATEAETPRYVSIPASAPFPKAEPAEVIDPPAENEAVEKQPQVTTAKGVGLTQLMGGRTYEGFLKGIAAGEVEETAIQAVLASMHDKVRSSVESQIENARFGIVPKEVDPRGHSIGRMVGGIILSSLHLRGPVSLGYERLKSLSLLPDGLGRLAIKRPSRLRMRTGNKKYKVSPKLIRNLDIYN
jgi:hypothetical protein